MQPASLDAINLFPGDLFPCGLVVLSHRIILACNAPFAGMFGYRREDLIGTSTERLYPSRKEFLDIGVQWVDTLHGQEQICDERIMVTRGDVPLWCRVRGRSDDRRDPFSLVACVFEPQQRATPAATRLTPREREIVAAMSEGLTSKEIGRRLKLSFRSVETYRLRMMRRLGARNANHLLEMLRGAPVMRTA